MQINLPRGIPVYEKVPASQFKPPTVLNMLRTDRHTGYAHYAFREYCAVAIFESGKLVGVVGEDGARRKVTGLDALRLLFDQVIVETGQLDVYSLGSDVAYGINALLNGNPLSIGQELRLLDVRRLFGNLRAQAFNGCVRVYTSDQTSLIFFRNGLAIGYFHDGASEIETSPEDFQRVAGLSGAMLDVLATSGPSADGIDDFFEIINIPALWESVGRSRAAELDKRSRDHEEKAREMLREALIITKRELEGLATAHAGKAGRAIVEKELSGVELESFLRNPNAADATFERIERSAKLLLGSAKATDLTSRMRGVIANRASRLRAFLN